ncbi:lipopolysaccharide biosynthesis protein [Ilyobacter sp.]|uniref:lipopolysaccharide biosynthesis protein n=1 Tax=Ilyobacter sp. TaxID=3100343 RepID=UPI0035632DEF
MSLKGELKSGVIINFITIYSSIAIKLVIWGVLARLLTPEQFGIVAVVSVFTAFFELMSNMGVGPAVIQNRDLTDGDNSSIFNFTFILGLIFAYGFYEFSYVIAKFYQNEEYIRIGKYLSVSVFFHSLSIVPMSLIRKKREFKKAGAIGVSSDLIIGAITIALAYRGMGYFVLVWKAILGSLYIFLFSFFLSDLKFKMHFDISPIKKIAGFSFYQFMFNLLNYFSKNLDNILIGKYIGVIPLGYYDKAYKLMLYSIQNMTRVITPVLLPILSNYQDKKELLYQSHLKLSKLLAIIGMPLSIFLFFNANEIIFILFGDQWGNSIPVFKILALTVWIQIILSSSGSIFQSTGRTDLLFLKGIVSAIFMIGGILYGVINKSLILVAYGWLASYIATFVFCYWLMFKKIFSRELKEFFITLKNPLLTAAFVFIPLFLLSTYASFYNLYISFALKTLGSAIGFFIGIYFTKEKKFLINLLLKK